MFMILNQKENDISKKEKKMIKLSHNRYVTFGVLHSHWLER